MSEPRKVTRVSAYAVCTDEDGRLLLCRISAQVPGFEGWWTLPGGGLDHGEDPREGAIRELREETGLDGEIMALLDVNSARRTWPRPSGEMIDLHGIRILFAARITGGELRDEADGTTDTSAWLTREEIAAAPCVDLVGIALELLDSR